MLISPDLFLSPSSSPLSLCLSFLFILGLHVCVRSIHFYDISAHRPRVHHTLYSSLVAASKPSPLFVCFRFRERKKQLFSFLIIIIIRLVFRPPFASRRRFARLRVPLPDGSSQYNSQPHLVERMRSFQGRAGLLAPHRARTRRAGWGRCQLDGVVYRCH